MATRRAMAMPAPIPPQQSGRPRMTRRRGNRPRGPFLDSRHGQNRPYLSPQGSKP